MSPKDANATLKKIISHTDLYLVSLSSKTYVFEDKMIKYYSDYFVLFSVNGKPC